MSTAVKKLICRRKCSPRQEEHISVDGLNNSRWVIFTGPFTTMTLILPILTRSAKYRRYQRVVFGKGWVLLIKTYGDMTTDYVLVLVYLMSDGMGRVHLISLSRTE